MGDVIQLADSVAVHIALCSNPETLCDMELDADSCWKGEATLDAVGEAQRVISDKLNAFAHEESSYQAWHGGYCQKADWSEYGVAVDFYRRELEEEEDAEGDDEPIYGAWRHCGPSKLDDELVTRVKATAEAASQAISKTLAEWAEKD